MKILEVVVTIMNDDGNYQWNECYPNESHFRNDLMNNQLYVVEDSVSKSIAGFAGNHNKYSIDNMKD